jgi:hypothetical protein
VEETEGRRWDRGLKREERAIEWKRAIEETEGSREPIFAKNEAKCTDQATPHMRLKEKKCSFFYFIKGTVRRNLRWV